MTRFVSVSLLGWAFIVACLMMRVSAQVSRSDKIGVWLPVPQTLTNKRFTFQDGATVVCLRERCATLEAVFAGSTDIERHLHACHPDAFPQSPEFESALGKPAPRRSERLAMQAATAARCEATTDVLLHRLEAK